MKPKVIAYSDNVCPFCTIGAKRIEKLKKELDFDIEWRPFELHPEVSIEGMSMDDYFRGAGADIVNNVLDYGKDVGIEINTRSLYNSKNSLKVNEYAKLEGKLEVFHKAIFKAYLEDDKNIGKVDTLLDIAEAVGLDRTKTKTFIESEAAENLVMDSKKEALRLGITSVPSFIIGQNLIRGAYPYDTMKEMFTKAFEV
ncbi:MAG: DsbA family oxidoreductase [Cyclobacteriaceae bacterium]|nr:DsbA family oxidoreductase [Cyclobacteriaceae bacterium]